MVGLLKDLKGKVVRNKLTVIGVGSLLLLMIMLLGIVGVLFYSYLERFTSNRSELIERDLKDIVGQFDTDERYVLNRNIDAFLKSGRELSPLLLPRQYYVSLPSGNSKFVPRQPPRNCFVKLANKFNVETQNDKTPERFCAYFAEPQNVGKYLFLSFSINDKEVVTLRKGDSTFSADGLRVSINSPTYSGVWWMYFQQAPKVSVPGRYQITAFKENLNGSLELDRRLEGWAFEQHQSDNTKVVNILARLDFKSFIAEGDEEWPPKRWHEIEIRLARVDKYDSKTIAYDYPKFGESFLSIPSISNSILNSFANLELVLPSRKLKILNGAGDKSSYSSRYFNNDYDLLIQHEPILERSLQLQDTDITFKVTQSKVLIENTLWITLIYMLLVTVVFVFAALYIYMKVMRPIFVLARQARQMINAELSPLPYANQRNEIGDLSGAFNDLLKERELQAIKRANLERDARIKYEEEVKSRDATIQFIGHEIRSPLQSLRDLLTPGTPAFRYTERMTNAINTLEDISGPNTLFSSRKLYLDNIELGQYLEALAVNCDPSQFPDVIYEGPANQVLVHIDETILEDAITNILINANRHREKNTNIVIKLRADEEFAVIDIFNNGPHIPDDCLSKIFELGFSTRSNDKAINKGIGLHAVKQYISRLNGFVHAQNVVLGVSFVIRIPLIEPKK